MFVRPGSAATRLSDDFEHRVDLQEIVRINRPATAVGCFLHWQVAGVDAAAEQVVGVVVEAFIEDHLDPGIAGTVAAGCIQRAVVTVVVVDAG